MLLLSEPGLTVKLKTWVVPSGATFVILRKPPPGVTTQSNGLLLPLFPSDGYVHTFASTAFAGR